MFRRAAERRGADPAVLTELARFYDAHGMDEQADAAYARAVAVSGRNAPALARYAFFLERKNRRSELLAMCRNYLDRFPDDARANLHYGLALFRQGDHEGCLAPLRKAASSSAQAIEALSALGDAYQKLDRLEEAIAVREQVLNLSDAPEAKQVLYDMGVAYRSMERTAKAIEIFERHLQMFPRSLWTLQALHDLYAAGGYSGEAARMRMLREKLTPPMPIDRSLDLGARVLGLDLPPETAESGATILAGLYILFTGNPRGRALPELSFRALPFAGGAEVSLASSPRQLGPGPCFRGDVLIESFALTIPPDTAPGRYTISVAAVSGTGPIPLWPIEIRSVN
ncbi:MAG TPA: tetratricopeptide repeat protein, partial [Candidatus Hydrogenedentes bacterium]|nr:tetratricopeptide repeat protein [Candidatus Hydrogenedentota bacterium]